MERSSAPELTSRGLSKEERKSLTHGDFWIPEAEREIYKAALHRLNESGIPYVVTGAYAIYEHTGIYRDTKDLDVFVEPEQLIPAMQVLREIGFRPRLEQAHWLAKAIDGEHFIDVIFGMGNGLALVDSDWFRHSSPAILAATPVRIAPAEELIWHRLFINERHRHDMADILHLMLCRGHTLNWDRLLRRTGPAWPLLLAQIQIFSYVYPQAANRIPKRIVSELLDRAREDLNREQSSEPVTRGTVISKFSFAIDVGEWGFKDLREEWIAEKEQLPIVREIIESQVWDERSEMVDLTYARITSGDTEGAAEANTAA